MNKHELNVLITCVGRRNYLVDYFKNALGSQGSVITTNTVAEASGMIAADKRYISPPIVSAEYVPFLLDLCEKEQIAAIIPLFDVDLSVLAVNKDRFREKKIQVIVSDPDIIEKCFDKLSYPGILAKTGVSIPRSFTSPADVSEAISDGRIHFPLVLKPRWGMNSISTEIVHSNEELVFFFDHLTRKLKTTYISKSAINQQPNAMIIQEFIHGREMGMDVINDLNGNYQATFIKRKLGMRSGETDGAVTVRDPALETIGKALSAAIHHISVLDIDLIIDNNNVPFVIDMNPRFGGGYPFSHVAGADIPSCILNWIREIPAEKQWLTVAEGVTGVKGISLYCTRAS